MATSPANKLSRGVVGLWPKTGGCGPLHTHTHTHIQYVHSHSHTHTGRHREGRNFLRLLLTDAVFVVGWYPHFVVVVVVVGWNPIGIWQKRSPRPLPKQKYRASCSLCLICVAFFALLCETFNDILNLPNTFCVCLLHLLKYTRHTHTNTQAQTQRRTRTLSLTVMNFLPLLLLHSLLSLALALTLVLYRHWHLT